MLKRLRNLVNPPAIPARGMSGVSPLLRNDPPAIERRAEILAGKNIPYTLKRSSRRRSIGLRIDGRGLTVCVPMRASEKWLRTVLQEKADWVVEKLEGWCARKPVEFSWSDGERVPYGGEWITLRVVRGLFAAPALRSGNELHVYVATGSAEVHVKQAVLHWYRCEAEKLFKERVAHFASLLGVMPRSVKISAAKTHWGSCTPGGSVLLNVGLIRLSSHLVDYVVAHELAHLRELNHSAAFWRVVESVCPDFADRRKELRAYSPCLETAA